jgi:hypothetical protein
LAPRRAWPGWAAAAALLAALVGAGIVFLFSPEPARMPVYREQPGEAIESVVPESRPLPRDAFVLRWADVSPGALYDITVTDARLRTLARGLGLREPHYRVPEEALAATAAGDRILWQVSARLPDGRRVESPTFVATVR